MHAHIRHCFQWNRPHLNSTAHTTTPREVCDNHSFFVMTITTYLSLSLLCCSRTTASLEVRLADGPGRCAGRLEMKRGGDWFRVAQQWSDDNSHVVCKELRCGKALLGKTLDKISQGSLPYLDMLFACGKTSDKLSTCPAVASERKQQNPQLTMLVCEGVPASSSLMRAIASCRIICRILLLIN